MDRSNEPSPFAWIMTATVGAVAVGGLVWGFVARRKNAAAQADDGQGYLVDDDDEAQAHPS